MTYQVVLCNNHLVSQFSTFLVITIENSLKSKSISIKGTATQQWQHHREIQM